MALDFAEFETTTGGTWRIAGCRDWYSKYEHPWHVSPTGNKHDAIAAVELALADYQALFGHPLADACPIDPVTGEVLPVVTIVTDNGGPFRSIDFELFITSHPELHHVRTRVRSPGQNGSRERGFGTLKHERLFLDEIPDALTLVERAEDYRVEYNTQRPHEAIAWNRPLDVHLGRHPRAEEGSPGVVVCATERAPPLGCPAHQTAQPADRRRSRRVGRPSLVPPALRLAGQ